MALEREQNITVADYLEIAKSDPDRRYEYLDGEIYLMAGGSLDHSAIAGNIYAILKHLLRGGPCRVYNPDPRVRVSATRYFHPDATVTCDPRDRGNVDLIQSTRLVVEVLSPSTEARDRGRKLQCYLACPTIEEYLLVDSRRVKIELYRKEQNKWVYYSFEAGDEVELASLGVHFPVIDVYEDITFAEKKKKQPQK